MKTYSFADARTGVFSGHRFSTSEIEHISVQTPEGVMRVAGAHDHLTKRVDIATGEIIDYQPPQPALDHEWSDTTKRWRLSAATQEKIDAARSARTKIAELEAQQPRALRELVLGDASAIHRLKDIDDQIIELRTQL